MYDKYTTLEHMHIIFYHAMSTLYIVYLYIIYNIDNIEIYYR